MSMSGKYTVEDRQIVRKIINLRGSILKYNQQLNRPANNLKTKKARERNAVIKFTIANHEKLIAQYLEQLNGKYKPKWWKQ